MKDIIQEWTIKIRLIPSFGLILPLRPLMAPCGASSGFHKRITNFEIEELASQRRHHNHNTRTLTHIREKLICKYQSQNIEMPLMALRIGRWMVGFTRLP